MYTNTSPGSSGLPLNQNIHFKSDIIINTLTRPYLLPAMKTSGKGNKPNYSQVLSQGDVFKEKVQKLSVLRVKPVSNGKGSLLPTQKSFSHVPGDTGHLNTALGPN